jgi:transcription initiation factor TFIIIB Brf1 subunit/transcription initiation factor TFIIB
MWMGGSPYDSQGKYHALDFKKLNELVRTENRGKDRKHLAFAEIRRISDILGIEDGVVEEANRIYLHAINTDLANNYTLSSLSAGSLYTACRDSVVPITLGNIEATSRVDVTSTSGGQEKQSFNYNKFGKIYNKICDRTGRSYLPVPPQKFVARYSNDLNLYKVTREIANVSVIKTEIM